MYEYRPNLLAARCLRARVSYVKRVESFTIPREKIEKKSGKIIPAGSGDLNFQ